MLDEYVTPGVSYPRPPPPQFRLEGLVDEAAQSVTGSCNVRVISDPHDRARAYLHIELSVTDGGVAVRRLMEYTAGRKEVKP